MIRKEDVIAIAKRAYEAGHEDCVNGGDCQEGLDGIEDMVSEVLADCENYNENLN